MASSARCDREKRTAALGSLVVLAEDIGPKWLHWPWVSDHLDEIRSRLTEHVELTVATRWASGCSSRSPLAVLSVRHRRALRADARRHRRALHDPGARVLRAAGAAHRAVLAVDRDHPPRRVHPAHPGAEHRHRVRRRSRRREGSGGRAWATRGRGSCSRVELPLALPAIIVGIRIAVVTTIGLVTVTALIGQGGLGSLMLDGFKRDFRTPLTVGIVLSLALAVIADLILVGVLYVATPWRRAGSRAPRRAGATRLQTPAWRRSCRRGALTCSTSSATSVRSSATAPTGRATRASRRLLRQHLQLSVVVGAGRDRRSRCRSASCSATCAPVGALAINVLNIGRALPALALLILAVQWFGIGASARARWRRCTLHARVHRDVRARDPTDPRQHLRGSGRASTTRRARRPAGMGMNGAADAAAGRAPVGGAADHGRRAHRHGRGHRHGHARRLRRRRRASAATSSTASPCTTT